MVHSQFETNNSIFKDHVFQKCIIIIKAFNEKLQILAIEY